MKGIGSKSAVVAGGVAVVVVAGWLVLANREAPASRASTARTGAPARGAVPADSSSPSAPGSVAASAASSSVPGSAAAARAETEAVLRARELFARLEKAVGRNPQMVGHHLGLLHR